MKLRLFSDKNPTVLQSKVAEFAVNNTIIKAFEPKTKGGMVWFCVEYVENQG